MGLGIVGKRALVSGADSGIGLHTAKQLLAEGAKVVITDKDPQKLEAAAKKLEADGASSGAVFAFSADITDVESLDRLHQQVRESLGDVDILVHCAGITGERGLFHEVGDVGWVEAIEVDLLGAVLGFAKGSWVLLRHAVNSCPGSHHSF